MIARVIYRLVDVRANELIALIWAFFYFFFLLCAYYILRPVRDEMGIQGGIDNLPWVFTGTFIAMLAMVPLFGWVSSRFPRRRLLPAVYGFFIINLILFYLMFHSGWHPPIIARAFFIWISVFNLFVVSVFWSYMNDLFDQALGALRSVVVTQQLRLSLLVVAQRDRLQALLN